jgi:hypothetical protein
MLTAAAFLQQCARVPRDRFARVLDAITALKVCECVCLVQSAEKRDAADCVDDAFEISVSLRTAADLLTPGSLIFVFIHSVLPMQRACLLFVSQSWIANTTYE